MPALPGHEEPLSARVSRFVTEGESYEMEFKGESRAPLNDRDLVEAVVCLANGSGGTLLVGVEDDGTVTGARPRHESGRTDPLRIQALVANSTQPPLAVTAAVVQVSGQEVLVVEVPDSPRVVGTTRGTYVRRAVAGDGSPVCLPYHAHEMLAHEVDRGAVDWAGLRVAGAEWSDLDPLEFERLRQMAGNASGGADRVLGTLSDREIASALGFTRLDAEVTTGGLLLFGRAEAIRRFAPTHEAAFQVLRGLDVEVNDFLPLSLAFASAGAVTCGVPSWTVSLTGRLRPDCGCFTPSDRYLIELWLTAGRRVRGRAGGGAGRSPRRAACCGRGRR
jgi:ATP-dependent DNA helicase RecG